MRLRAVFLSAALLLSLPLTSQTPPAPANLDFEQGQPGETPPGWFVPTPSTQAGYTVKIVTERPEAGRQAVQVAFEGQAPNPRAFGNLMTTFDAAGFRGKRVRFRAAVRAEAGQGNWAALWLRVDREGGARGFFDNMGNRPITAAGWKDYEIVGDVAPDARTVNIGFMLIGAGKAWIDSASFEVVGESGAGNEPARPLSARGLENLAAFTRLLGYVRYFHPSDQAASADWEKLALAGVQKAEGASGPTELARVLEDFFRPVAPTVRVYPTAGARPEVPAGLSPPAGVADPEAVAWEHLGVQVSSEPSIYRSRRVGNLPTAPEDGSALLQYVEAAPYRGKRVVLRAWSRAEVQGAHKAALGLSVYRKDESKISQQKAEITSPEWRVYEVAAEVAPDAEAMMIAVGLIAEGRSWWDDVTLEVEGGGPAKTLLKNGDFEAAREESKPSGWSLGGTAERAGYRAVLSEEAPKSGRRSLAFSWARPDPSVLPKPGEIFVADLGGGVSAMVPLALYKDEKGTLPHVAPDVRPPSPEKPEGFAPSGHDRTTRLAGVALAWNVFQHFYPYFDVVQTDWPAELRRALSSAATDRDDLAFVDTLRRLVAALHDGHGGVYYPNNSFRMPLLWDWVEDQLVVTRVAPEGAGELRRGDVILTLDGRPAREALAAAEELISAATPQWRRYLGLGRIARCRQEKQVHLEVRRPTGETFTATVACSLPLEGPALEEDRPEKIAEVRPGIFYVDIDRISDDDFKGALDRLAAAKGVVFDLRGYPRNLSTIVIAHLTGETLTSARWNVPLIHRPDRKDVKWEFSNWPVEPAEPRIRGKAAFITDGRAISYAETYMGIIEHYKLAAIVGGPTAGTNGNINPFALPGGYSLIWTGMRVLKHDGSQLHGIGIQPTVPASRTLKGVAEGRDELLEKAVEVVGGGGR
ncbi:MAG TPA: S41 family peptidase [Thermoanaerobaculia bacterium]